MPEPTWRSAKLALAVPARLTVSPLWGAPSLAVPVPAACALCKAGVPDSAAVAVPSYTLPSADRPATVSVLAVMLAVAVTTLRA